MIFWFLNEIIDVSSFSHMLNSKFVAFLRFLINFILLFIFSGNIQSKSEHLEVYISVYNLLKFEPFIKKQKLKNDIWFLVIFVGNIWLKFFIFCSENDLKCTQNCWTHLARMKRNEIYLHIQDTWEKFLGSVDRKITHN